MLAWNFGIECPTYTATGQKWRFFSQNNVLFERKLTRVHISAKTIFRVQARPVADERQLAHYWKKEGRNILNTPSPTINIGTGEGGGGGTEPQSTRPVGHIWLTQSFFSSLRRDCARSSIPFPTLIKISLINFLTWTFRSRNLFKYSMLILFVWFRNVSIFTKSFFILKS